MRTIDTILEYNLSNDEVEGLLSCGIINGCGATNGFSFDDFIMNNIEYLPEFNQDKKQEFICDLKRICYEHDIDFHFKMGFIKANYKMSKKLYKLTHWIPWKYRIIASIILFIMLEKFGKITYQKQGTY